MLLADMNPPCLPDFGSDNLFSTDRPRLIDLVKSERARVLTALQESLNAGNDNGWTAALRLAHWTDVAITEIFSQIQDTLPQSRRTPMALIGLGGYGRSQLFLIKRRAQKPLLFVICKITHLHQDRRADIVL